MTAPCRVSLTGRGERVVVASGRRKEERHMRDEPAQPRSLNAKLATTADAESTSLILVCIIICLVAVGLFVLVPAVELSADQINQVVLWGP